MPRGMGGFCFFRAWWRMGTWCSSATSFGQQFPGDALEDGAGRSRSSNIPMRPKGRCGRQTRGHMTSLPLFEDGLDAAHAKLRLVAGGSAAGTAENPSIGDHFAQLWRGICRHIDAREGALMRLHDEERRFAPCEDYMAAVKLESNYGVLNEKREYATRILARIIDYAEKKFAPAGGSLVVNRDDISDRFSFDRESLDRFKPAKIWQYLEDTYGGNAGNEIASRQLADALYKDFGFSRNDAVARSGGYVVLNVRVYMDDFDKKHFGKNNLHYNSLESVVRVLKNLSEFANWMDNSRLAMEADRFASEFWHSRGNNIGSRSKRVLGDNEIVLVMFLKRFEFRLSEPVANQLQIFLGTYGPQSGG